MDAGLARDVQDPHGVEPLGLQQLATPTRQSASARGISRPAPGPFRGGVLAIPKGQWEAGLSIGMSRRLLLRRIILPQALRIVIPALGNFFVSIFKDSALVSVVTMRDLMFSGQILAAATFKHFEIFAMVAAIYFLISYPTAKFVEYIEQRLDISRAKHVEAQARG